MSEPPKDRAEHPLARYRRRHKLTLANFAMQVGTTQGTLSRIETGAREPTAGMLRLIVAATGGEVTADEIINAHYCAAGTGRR